MLRKIVSKYGKILAALSLFVGVASSTCACHYIFHQPEVPEKMKELVAAKSKNCT